MDMRLDASHTQSGRCGEEILDPTGTRTPASWQYRPYPVAIPTALSLKNSFVKKRAEEFQRRHQTVSAFIPILVRVGSDSVIHY
jgi:hypothetical protein